MFCLKQHSFTPFLCIILLCEFSPAFGVVQLRWVVLVRKNSPQFCFKRFSDDNTIPNTWNIWHRKLRIWFWVKHSNCMITYLWNLSCYPLYTVLYVNISIGIKYNNCANCTKFSRFLFNLLYLFTYATYWNVKWQFKSWAIHAYKAMHKMLHLKQKS